MQSRFRARIAAVTLAVALAAPTFVHAQRQMEALGRGVVAVVRDEGKVFVGWRLLGTEPADVGFNVYRQTAAGVPQKLNDKPLTGATHFVDEKADLRQPTTYTVRPVTGDAEGPAGAAFTVKANAPAQGYLSVPLQQTAGYVPNDASVADLDGDGEYEIILQQTGRAQDNSVGGVTDPP
ncbi:MAG TPA: rhamnogalacturonan lyase, partial [Tepidisphaeraceae bacterium]